MTGQQGLQQQSPINLQNAVFADLGREGLSIHWKGEIYGHVHKDDHGVKVSFASDMRQFISLGGKRFHLRQFHFHHPSEHWVDGGQHTMELHVVHQNVDDGSLAVMGIFIEPGGGKKTLPSLMGQIETLLSADSDENAGVDIPTDAREFLPDTWEQYFRYEGSLTTPPYSENVSWVVIKEALLIPKAKLEKWHELFKAEARFPQPINRRFILKTFDAPKPPKRK